MFNSEVSALITDLRTFVGEEFAMQRRKFAEQLAEPWPDRVEQGTCLAELQFTRLDETGRAVFRHEGNDSRLREGDAVRLSHAELPDGFQGTIFREEAKELWVAVAGKFKPDTFANREDEWLLDEWFIDLEKHYLEALERLSATEIGRERILPLLLGTAELGFDEGEYNAMQEELAQGTFWEETQRDALAGCLAAEHCYLVQGPPGTGKTRVLAQVIRELVAQGERVLLTGITHRSIDHALAGVAREIGGRVRVARFAAATHRRAENYDSFEQYAESPCADLTGGWVAGATPFALRKRLKGVEFDTVVIDEAGQMTTPLAVMAMLAGRKYLLFGDQRQLGPVMTSRTRREGQELGIYQALRGQAVEGSRLEVTYRLNDILTTWPSENFYEGALQSAPGVAEQRLAWEGRGALPAWIRAALNPDHPLVWMPFAPDRSRTTNAAEVAMATELLSALYEGGVPPEAMAVVTPYRRQARRLRRRLETLLPHVSWRECVIDTVERMQGQEREVIIVSLCASDPMFIRMQAQFLYDPRRLNVAITRARSKLVILASNELLAVAPDDPDLAEEVALMRSLHNFAVKVPVNDPS